MARRKTKKRTHHRRRRMSGTGSDMMTNVLYVAGGAIAGRMVNNLLVSTVKLSPTIAAAGTIGIGIFVPKFLKGPIGAGVGSGMIAAGAISLGTSMGVISGTDAFRVYMPPTPVKNMGGANLPNLKSVSGANLPNLKSVSGYVPGSRVNGYSGYSRVGGYAMGE